MPRVSLKSLGFKSYADYLKSAAWKRFKARHSESLTPQVCCVCKLAPVQFHHITYVRLGREWITDVILLCPEHHRQVHAYHRRTKTPVTRWREALTAIVGIPDKTVTLKRRRRRRKKQT